MGSFVNAENERLNVPPAPALKDFSMPPGPGVPARSSHWPLAAPAPVLQPPPTRSTPVLELPRMVQPSVLAVFAPESYVTNQEPPGALELLFQPGELKFSVS